MDTKSPFVSDRCGTKFSVYRIESAKVLPTGSIRTFGRKEKICFPAAESMSQLQANAQVALPNCVQVVITMFFA